MTELSMKTDLELSKEWSHKLVEWTHPYSKIVSNGRITKVKDGFLIVKDRVGTEGIREEWITYTYK